jgi:hypothetical protein
MRSSSVYDSGHRLTLEGVSVRATLEGLVLQSTAADWSPASRAGMLQDCFVTPPPPPSTTTTVDWDYTPPPRTVPAPAQPLPPAIHIHTPSHAPPRCLQVEHPHDVTLFKSFNIKRITLQFIDAEADFAPETPQSPAPSSPPAARPSSTIFDMCLTATVALTLSSASLAPISVVAACTIPSLQLNMNDKQIVSMYTLAFALSRLDDKLEAAKVQTRLLKP